MKGKYFLRIDTRQLKSLIKIFDLFYIFKNGKYTKSINKDLFHYLDYLVLAH